MTMTGTRTIPERIIPEKIEETRACDICGKDSTGRIPCTRCKKDLCSNHQIDVKFYSAVDEGWDGLYCKVCLIAEINEKYG